MTTEKSRQSVIKDNRLTTSGSRNDLPIIQQGDNLLIDARILHQQLKSGYQFQDWIKRRIQEFGFEPNKDFFTSLVSEKSEPKKRGGNRLPTTQVHLTLDMAKELAMLEKNEEGRYWRRYFIQKEKESRLPVINFKPLEGFLLADFLKGMKPFKINGENLYPYREVVSKLGYSARAGADQRKKVYGQHFIKIGDILYITEDFARHLAHSRAVYINRAKMKASQPLLPFNFGDTSNLNLSTHGNIR